MTAYTLFAIAAYAFLAGAWWGATTAVRRLDKHVIKPMIDQRRLDHVEFIRNHFRYR